jgi:hypothetical protein
MMTQKIGIEHIWDFSVNEENMTSFENEIGNKLPELIGELSFNI